jgi:hypothetical protein
MPLVPPVMRAVLFARRDMVIFLFFQSVVLWQNPARSWLLPAGPFA